MKTKNGLSNIKIYLQIDSPKFRNLLRLIRGNGYQSKKHSIPLELEFNIWKYEELIKCDVWMGW
jgi:hypothetical protein